MAFWTGYGTAKESGAVNELLELSIVIPCLNEERTIAICVEKARKAFQDLKIEGEVLVVDNGSQDRSSELAGKAGARVVHQGVKGYGSALKKGFEEASGRYIIMGDADGTYDFSAIGDFVRQLRSGSEFVMGSRMRGVIFPGAMPWLHRYFGTPLLTMIINRFFRTRISDVNCGMRGFTRAAILKLGLSSKGMEFASEMIIKAAMSGLDIREIPINLYQSPVERTPHLRSFSDGWRHLRFMLFFCPKYLFLYPGLLLFVIGMVFMVLFFLNTTLFGIPFGLSTMVLACALLLMGMQVALFGVFALLFQTGRGMAEEDGICSFLRNNFTLERGLITGGILLFLGLLAFFAVILIIISSAMWQPHVNVPLTKAAIASIFIMLLGIQIIFSSFYLCIINPMQTLD